MARSMNFIVLLSIIIGIVVASGCTSNTSNNTPTPTATTPETQVTPLETPTPVLTPSSVAESSGSVVNMTSTSVANGTYVENGTHVSTTERNLQIEQRNKGVTSTVNNGTLTVKVSEKENGLETNPLSTAKKNTNPFNITGNNAVVTSRGPLKIIPANTSTTNNTGN